VDAKRTTQAQIAALLVKVYKKRGVGFLFSLGQPFAPLSAANRNNLPENPKTSIKKVRTSNCLTIDSREGLQEGIYLDDVLNALKEKS